MTCIELYTYTKNWTTRINKAFFQLMKLCICLTSHEMTLSRVSSKRVLK